eukprot:m.37879 g.37879  ORF g.37879 m.37879 type:complete len:1589 (-) comp10142_c0_seq2:886-5652(-)
MRLDLKLISFIHPWFFEQACAMYNNNVSPACYLCHVRNTISRDSHFFLSQLPFFALFFLSETRKHTGKMLRRPCQVAAALTFALVYLCASLHTASAFDVLESNVTLSVGSRYDVAIINGSTFLVTADSGALLLHHCASTPCQDTFNATTVIASGVANTQPSIIAGAAGFPLIAYSTATEVLLVACDTIACDTFTSNTVSATASVVCQDVALVNGAPTVVFGTASAVAAAFCDSDTCDAVSATQSIVTGATSINACAASGTSAGVAVAFENDGELGFRSCSSGSCNAAQVLAPAASGAAISMTEGGIPMVASVLPIGDTSSSVFFCADFACSSNTTQTVNSSATTQVVQLAANPADDSAILVFFDADTDALAIASCNSTACQAVAVAAATATLPAIALTDALPVVAFVESSSISLATIGCGANSVSAQYNGTFALILDPLVSCVSCLTLEVATPGDSECASAFAIKTSDIAAFSVFFVVFLSTMVWAIIFFWWQYGDSSKGQQSRQRRNRSHKRKRTIVNRQVNKQATYLLGKVHQLFWTAERMQNLVRRLELRRSAAGELVKPNRRKAIDNFYALAVSIEDTLVSVLNAKYVECDSKFVEDPSELEILVAQASAQGNSLEVMLDNNPTVDAIENAKAQFDQTKDNLVKLMSELDEKYQERLEWDVSKGQFADTVARVKSHIGFKDQDLSDLEIEQSHASMSWWELIPPAMRLHPWFYIFFFGMYLSVLLSFFVNIGRVANLQTLDKQNDRNVSLILGRRTFLPLPPYYDIENVPFHGYVVPFIYGFMHSALYCFGWLPFGMWRGTLRDLSLKFPRLRNVVPLDDIVNFHRLCGSLTLFGILMGGILFLFTTSVTCLKDGVAPAATQAAACEAVNPVIIDAVKGGIIPLLYSSLPGASYFDPRDNVVFLREIVWITWFFFIPLLQFGTKPAPQWLPAAIKRNWFEIVYYIHFVIAIVSLVLALYARFEVFYPIIFSWAWYILDRWRDMIWHTFKCKIVIDVNPGAQTTMCHESSTTGQPVLVNLRITKPQHWKPEAGQWLYLKVPGIDPIWHPFSLASASQEEYVHLHIGIRGSFDQDTWEQPASSMTWTYQLYQQFLDYSGQAATSDSGRAEIECKLRGPYGSPFTKCFDPAYPAVIVMGAGTGLTSALSVLKELIYQRIENPDAPVKYVWFMWTCSRVDDLLWLWKPLESLLYEAYRKGAINLDDDWRPVTSNMLGWLSVTIYVTRSVETLMNFLSNHRVSQPSISSGGLKRANTRRPDTSRWANQSDALSDKQKLAAIQEQEEFDAPPSDSGAGESFEMARLSTRRRHGTEILFSSAQHDDEADDTDSDYMEVPEWLVNGSGEGAYTRQLVETALLNPGLPAGSFLLRALEEPNTFELSVLQNDGSVKHFAVSKPLGMHVFTINDQLLSRPCMKIGSLIHHLSEDEDQHFDSCLLYLAKMPDNLAQMAFNQGDGEDELEDSKGDGRMEGDDQRQARFRGYSNVFGDQRPRRSETDINTLQEVLHKDKVPDIHAWLTQQVLDAPIDHNKAHVRRLFRWARDFVESTVPESKDIAIPLCFCGPAAVAHALEHAAKEAGAQMQFSAEHQ